MAKKNYDGKTKFIVVTGGVLSGLGKGICAASIGAILSSRLKIVPLKCDGYLNTDPGTMNPTEHGEVFVLDDGGEVDMDFGHYERYLDCNAKFKWNLTMGKIFKEILEKEREGAYLGKTVQFLPHVTDLIKDKFWEIVEEESPDIVLIEVGGTVGDLENQFYLEAVRQLGHDVGPNNVLYVHLTYVPIPSGVGEQKSKPTQMSVRDLNEKGIYPDVVVARCSEKIADNIKEKIARFCNIDKEAVISGEDLPNVYQIPLRYVEEGLPELMNQKLGLYAPPDLHQWSELVYNINKNQQTERLPVRIAICGKYTVLEDSYASVVEALNHAGAHKDLPVKIQWIDTEEVETRGLNPAEILRDVDGVIIPGGFGTRGIEGKIQIIRYVRENKIPFMGICYGMQLAVVEYSRNVCGWHDAHTEEIEKDGNHVERPVVCILENQKGVKDMGGTMRLGGHDIVIRDHSKAKEIYGSNEVRARFRHRYEVNPDYVDDLEKAGLSFSGKAKHENIQQILEITDHPFFVAGQFHPELTSTLLNPSKLFVEHLGASNNYAQTKRSI